MKQKPEILINRIDTIIHEYETETEIQNFIPASKKALRHIIHIAGTREDANEMLLYSIDLLSGVTDTIEEMELACRRVILGYASELKLALQARIQQ